MNILFTAKELEILNGDDRLEQKKLIMSRLDAFDGPIDDLLWAIINAKKNKSEKKDIDSKSQQPLKEDTDEEKKIEYKKETETLSMLIDFERGKKYDGMCAKGDVYFEEVEQNNVTCMKCRSNANVMKCYDCHKRDGVRQTLCKVCRVGNLTRLEYKSQIDNIKRNVIRGELLSKPSLSLDILCGLSRRTALNKLTKDIMRLEANDRGKYAVFLLDIDNFKALNSIFSHQGADEIIKHVGLALKHWCSKVDNGDVDGLDKAFAFRQGGDEFCIVTRSTNDNGACQTKFHEFLLSFKKQINGLASASFLDKYKPNKQALYEGMKTLKERKLHKIEAALSGVTIPPNIESKIRDAVDRMEIPCNISKICISVGLFVPKGFGLTEKENSWLECAERAREAAKKFKGKNATVIYYESANRLVPPGSTAHCLKYGCYGNSK